MTITDTPVHPAFRAAEIALVAIKQNRCTTWKELISSGVDHRLTEEQLNLVRQYEDTIVNHLSVARGKAVTVTWCPGCSRIALFAGGTVPAKCTLTHGCTTKPVKAGAPVRKPKPAGN